MLNRTKEGYLSRRGFLKLTAAEIAALFMMPYLESVAEVRGEEQNRKDGSTHTTEDGVTFELVKRVVVPEGIERVDVAGIHPAHFGYTKKDLKNNQKEKEYIAKRDLLTASPFFNLTGVSNRSNLIGGGMVEWKFLVKGNRCDASVASFVLTNRGGEGAQFYVTARRENEDKLWVVGNLLTTATVSWPKDYTNGCLTSKK